MMDAPLGKTNPLMPQTTQNQPMILHNSFQMHGVVTGQPMVPYPPQLDSSSQPLDSGLQHLLMLSTDTNLHTRHN